MPLEPALSLTNVTVDVAGKAYVRDVSVKVPRGEIHGLLGPNGAGKTTLLRCLYRAAEAATGQIQAQGKEITDYTHQEWAKNRWCACAKLRSSCRLDTARRRGNRPFCAGSARK